MEKLRMNLFLTVVDMLKQWSNPLHDGMICSFHDVRLNGEGLLKSITYSKITGTTVSYDNYYGNYTKEEIMCLGHCCAADYRNIRSTISKEYGISAHWGQVHGFCAAFCNAYWAWWHGSVHCLTHCQTSGFKMVVDQFDRPHTAFRLFEWFGG